MKDEYPYYTSYQYAGNKPIIATDLDGLEPKNEVEPEKETTTALSKTDIQKDEEGNVLSKTIIEGTSTIYDNRTYKLDITVKYYDYSNGPLKPIVESFSFTGNLPPTPKEKIGLLLKENTTSLDRYIPEVEQLEALRYSIDNPISYNAPQTFLGPEKPEVSDLAKELNAALYYSTEPVAGRSIPLYGPYAQAVKALYYGNREAAAENLLEFGVDIALFAVTELAVARGVAAVGNAARGSRGLVNLTEETFSQALFNGAERIGGYSIHGTKGLVGNTFNRNIFLIEASGSKSLSGFRSLVGSLEAEALGAGANRISIYVSSVINKGFLNPRIANRFGYSFQQSGSGVFLQKTLR
ncbi:MAG: hypothetical protein WBA74_07800 [Cyclobacteriaceae bacterium]